MIIWREKGGLVLLALIIGSVLGYWFINRLPLGDSNPIIFFIEGLFTTLLTAGINYFLTKRYISDEVQTHVNEQTGERVQVKDRSSLFFIPNNYWTWIFLIFGLVLNVAVTLRM
ncbi:hypothetical protein [Enterococcus songbeiensis]|uniref:hypothetical protein n=1 Tax=Enterococcus songbeiensis TaxID=2559927 RepID=UPI0010F55104|nr:hypothetical protein [Enterococcus songbeiensis]